MKIHPTAVVHPKAEIGRDVIIGPYTVVEEEVFIGDNTEVASNVLLEKWTTIGKECEVSSGAKIGGKPQDQKFRDKKSFVKIGDNSQIREFVTIHRSSQEERATVIGSNVMVMAYSHVAHDCEIGDNVVITNYVGLSGHVKVEERAIISGFVGIHQFCKIGKLALISGFSGVSKDVPPFVIVRGVTTKPYGLNIIGLKRNNIPEEAIDCLKEAYCFLFQSGLNVSQALERIKSEIPKCNEIDHLVGFIENSERGICK
ncbi:MAG: acyl-[acyl-carrier-protein]--UDP-N-acetylglucosamine O-acyltransferase [Candidatus Schekmanbacteria bacterium GWA2_38_9]|uniref:Acyl-[acyl-carrier-protein]--UDP-N-acetylglucosamine O-acyltransferase n=1 Tax=Candidatus Schekmanbacteria bacterium RIFCSPLOWO2_12_FULL_38_15 TaxID=1817883 RepID=A0A1F7SMP0_9BACT|nr:MAG: acyl-[acyl-carrier-protein]--UDP-N-acetylglucosamine O-acyltransferase [Candidatus Schekmanbacteria bacterium GWA2_38_9]OGL48031.1 MAG: acyl-[acyl-carrier-protein]--UDP-N-acetylglucosamine O-acyltransferase [Candidatus Schekmanbacteria bacterium RIFCSPLOWO2_02_FULL_38_14]OGL54484.1 MAG: acyl-[acyl-carrier-protein]--UDP-N-acetylglucosamine O-acyltransferase [Candidatus Schekmanbacteria bacterium RIFCSPLOWO2_12_FULL_38_15]